MTIEQSKEKLQKEGYTYFELKEFDPEFYNWLLPVKFTKNSKFKERFTFLRADVNDIKTGDSIIQLNKDFNSFENAEQKKNEIFSKLKLFGDDSTSYVNQIWYFTDLENFLQKSNLSKDIYKKYIEKIIKYFFDENQSEKYSLITTATFYDTGCFLTNHSDGKQMNRICAILIYLNETYDENNGGCLVLNNNEVVPPLFGNVVIIDLYNFDIEHMVTKLTGGDGRYTLLSFVNKM